MHVDVPAGTKVGGLRGVFDDDGIWSNGANRIVAEDAVRMCLPLSFFDVVMRFCVIGSSGDIFGSEFLSDPPRSGPVRVARGVTGWVSSSSDSKDAMADP